MSLINLWFMILTYFLISLYSVFHFIIPSFVVLFTKTSFSFTTYFCRWFPHITFKCIGRAYLNISISYRLETLPFLPLTFPSPKHRHVWRSSVWSSVLSYYTSTTISVKLSIFNYWHIHIIVGTTKSFSFTCFSLFH